MTSQEKRLKVSAIKLSPHGITIRKSTENKNGTEYTFFVVSGWAVAGKRQRKRFPVKSKDGGDFETACDEAQSEAEQFKTDTLRNIKNNGRNQNTIVSPLTDEEHREAIDALERLKGTYTLTQAVEYFLKNHRPPEHTERLSDAIEKYIKGQTGDVRANTLEQKRSTLSQLAEALGDPLVHEVTKEGLKGFLSGLRDVTAHRAGVKAMAAVRAEAISELRAKFKAKGKPVGGVLEALAADARKMAAIQKAGDKAKAKGAPAKKKTWNNYRNDIHHFFAWASTADVETKRPYIFHNPVSEISIHTAKNVKKQRGEITVTDPADVQEIFTYLMNFNGGCMVKFFALAYFAGIRPGGELKKLGDDPGSYINTRTGFVTIPKHYSKTDERRKITISPNLRKWLSEYKDFDIIPPNFDRLYKQVRKEFGMSENERDETRHSFISYHVGLHRSIGEAALQAGNSERIVKQHYFDEQEMSEAEHFFSIIPDMEAKRAVRQPATKPTKLKALA